MDLVYDRMEFHISEMVRVSRSPPIVLNTVRADGSSRPGSSHGLVPEVHTLRTLPVPLGPPPPLPVQKVPGLPNDDRCECLLPLLACRLLLAAAGFCRLLPASPGCYRLLSPLASRLSPLLSCGCCGRCCCGCGCCGCGLSSPISSRPSSPRCGRRRAEDCCCCCGCGCAHLSPLLSPLLSHLPFASLSSRTGHSPRSYGHSRARERRARREPTGRSRHRRCADRSQHR